MRKYDKTIIVMFSVIIGLISIIYKENENKNDMINAQKLSKEYPLIQDSLEYYFKKIEGTIISKELYIGRFNKGALYLTLKDGFKFSIALPNNNYSYNPSELIFFIQVYDSILKPAENNIFYVFRNNQRYAFILGRDIKKE